MTHLYQIQLFQRISELTKRSPFTIAIHLGLCMSLISCGATHESKTSSTYDTHETVLSESTLEVGPINRPGDRPHCTAFAISDQFFLTSSDCIRHDHEFEPLEKEMEFKGLNKMLTLTVESIYPSKKMAVLSTTQPEKMHWLGRSFGEMSAAAVYDHRSSQLRLETCPDKGPCSFLKNDILYYELSGSQIAAGTPLVDDHGRYMGMHLGTAWHKGSYYSVGSYHGRAFDVFKTVSYKPDVLD